MKLKKVLSGFLSAAILATTTAIVMPLEVGAEDVELDKISASDIPVDQLTSATKAKITFNITTLVDSEYATMTAYVNGTPWQQMTFATTTQYASGAGQDWQANVEVTATGEQTATLDFTPANWGYEVGLKTDNADGISGELTKVEFLDSSGNVVATYDPNAESISTKNFNFSTISNEEMSIGDFFTITFDSANTPADAKFSFKYKIPKVENPSNNDDYSYFAPVENGEVTAQGQTETGLKVTSSTEGTKTIYKFEAVSASTANYPFSIGVELSRKGDWTDTDYSLWFGNISFYVPATAVPVESVAISGTGVANKKLSFEKGKDATLTATVTPDEASTEDKAVTWAVSAAEPAGCVTVGADGKVTAVAVGKATITATTAGKDADGNAVSDSVEVTVTVPATGVKIATPAKTNLVVNDELQLEAAAVPEDATDAAVITWSSSDTAIATVDANGKVTAKKAGDVEITATMGTFTDKVALKVTDTVTPATGIVLASENLKDGDLALFVGDVENMTATLTPEDSTDAVTWTSSNPAIAEVVNGKITAVSEGRTTISATANENVSAHILVTVTKKVIAITGVTLDKETASVEEGKTVTLTPTVAPADTTEDKTVTWKSSDETVATVKDGVVTAVKAGTANITATAGGKTATCAVTVTAKAEDPKPSGNALWEGTQDMTWSDSIQIAKEKFADLKAGDTIEITVTKAASGAQISLKSMGEGWPALPAFKKIDPEWGCDNISKADTYKYVMTEDDVKVLKADGMAVGGHDYTVTSVKLVAAAEEPIEKTEYETGKAETVNDYVPKETPAAGTKTELKVNSISVADAAKYSSYDITITVTLKDGTKKTATKSVSDCYKGFTYSNGTDNTTVKAAEGFFILVKVKNVPADATVEMSIKGVE